MQQLDLTKAKYPRWAETKQQRLKYLLLRTVLELTGEHTVLAAGKLIHKSPASMARAIENGIDPVSAVALESMMRNTFTRFDYCPELLKNEAEKQQYVTHYFK